MKRIFKYTINPNRPVELPVDAKVLSAHAQGDNICIWAEVDDARAGPVHDRWFDIVPTGQPVPSGRFVGTVLLYDGNLVFHVYERSDTPEGET